MAKKEKRKGGKAAPQRQIIEGGFRTLPGQALPNVVLQMPEVFFFDLKKYMDAVNAALSIDHTNRVRLYDMYASCRFDLHLAGILDKRLRAVARNLPLEFQRDGVADEVITPQLNSPWMKELRKEIVLTEFWGFSLLEFWTDEEGNIRHHSVNRKHVDPVRRVLHKFQGDADGVPLENFRNLLLLGDGRDLGVYAELLVAVLYKRGDISDWARFCNVFGMPIREYTYEAGDEEARRRLISDASRQGANAVYIHPKDSNLNLVEAGNKTGSADLYKTFAEYWDSKMSIRVLGNTLTTDAKETGTQSLGTVHKEEEEGMNASDCDRIVDVLNFHVKPILGEMGFNVEGGEFVYVRKEEVDTDKQILIVEKLVRMGLPVEDDYLYETFGVTKPADYDRLKAEKEEERRAMREALASAGNGEEGQEGDTPPTAKEGGGKPSFAQRLMDFFGAAPRKGGAASDF